MRCILTFQIKITQNKNFLMCNASQKHFNFVLRFWSDALQTIATEEVTALPVEGLDTRTK